MPGQWRPDEAAAEAAEKHHPLVPSLRPGAAAVLSEVVTAWSTTGNMRWCPAAPAGYCGRRDLLPAGRRLRRARSTVIACDLTKTGPGAIAALNQRPGQIVSERAPCRTDPPRVTADVSGLPAQMIIRPWTGQLRRLHDSTTGQGRVDDRPITAIAAEITVTSPGQTRVTAALPRPGEDPRQFAETITTPDAHTPTSRPPARQRVLQPQGAAGGEVFEGGGQGVDGAPGAAVVEQAAQFGEAALRRSPGGAAASPRAGSPGRAARGPGPEGRCRGRRCHAGWRPAPRRGR